MRNILLTLLILSFVIWGASVGRAGDNTCFIRDDNQGLKDLIIRQAPPPPLQNGQPPESYIGYPANLYVSTETSPTGITMLTANAAGKVFSTPLQADKCTLAQAKRLFGEPDSKKMDACVLPPAPQGNIAGLMIDYNPLDNRRPEEALALATELNALAKKHSAKFFFFTGDIELDGAANGLNGDVIQKIMAFSDGFIPKILATEPRKNWPARKIMQTYAGGILIATNGKHDPFTEDLKPKFIPALDPTHLSLQEAKSFSSAFRALEYGGIMILGAPHAGPCETDENQIIGCLAFGYCDGNMSH